MELMDLAKAKLSQASQLMGKHQLDCWIVSFARESGKRPDPMEYLVGTTVTWPSVFIVNKDGRSAAIVGSGDVGQVQSGGIWDDVRGYVASPREDLIKLLDEWKPSRIGVSWSADDDASDGITYGMYRLMESMLQGTSHDGHLVSAGPLAGEVRRRKLPDEIEAIHSAIVATEQLFPRIGGLLELGLTEKELQAEIQHWVHELGFGYSWEERMNPIVNFGPLSAPMGHSLPGDTRLQPGHLIHLDIGLRREGFSSDLQRTWYWLRDGEKEAPAEVRHAFEATLASLDAGMAQLRPGHVGWQVDAASRKAVMERGFPEPQFAFGHHVGRDAHDGAGVLGPRWERYGNQPEIPIEPGNVFAVEMDLEVPGYGVMGLEEEALVEEDGARFLSRPQRELWLLPT